MEGRLWVGGILVGVALCGGMLLHLEGQLTPTTGEMAWSEPKWILDAGHGGEDGGAVSLSGVPESGINLAITRKTDQLMGFLGEPTLLLRSEDISLHDDSAKTLREKKSSDLKNRTQLVNHQPDATLLSIHQNTFPKSQYWGAQVFYAPTDGSQELAEHLQRGLQQHLQPDNRRAAKQIPESVYLMNHVENRAVLVECGFLSNPQEEELLLNPSYQTQMAAVLAAGCVRTVPDPG